jgi:hypothetical protein
LPNRPQIRAHPTGLSSSPLVMCCSLAVLGGTDRGSTRREHASELAHARAPGKLPAQPSTSRHGAPCGNRPHPSRPDATKRPRFHTLFARRARPPYTIRPDTVGSARCGPVPSDLGSLGQAKQPSGPVWVGNNRRQSRWRDGRAGKLDPCGARPDPRGDGTAVRPGRRASDTPSPESEEESYSCAVPGTSYLV